MTNPNPCALCDSATEPTREDPRDLGVYLCQECWTEEEVLSAHPASQALDSLLDIFAAAVQESREQEGDK